jgi:hypothetical protein
VIDIYKENPRHAHSELAVFNDQVLTHGVSLRQRNQYIFVPDLRLLLLLFCTCSATDYLSIKYFLAKFRLIIFRSHIMILTNIGKDPQHSCHYSFQARVPTTQTMKLSLPFLLLLSTTTAFTIPTSTSRPTSSLAVASDPTTQQHQLIPPSKIDATSVASLFEERVQKTYGRYPITFVEGKGCWLVDEDGKKYLGEFFFG